MDAFLKSGKTGPDDKPSTSSSKATKKEKLKPWIEKYRPKSVVDVVEQTEVVTVLQECISGADLPNLLFYGPPGTGKTSTILAAAHQLFGDMYRDRILELNASDERGIQVIRDKVKTFSQLTASGVRPDGKACPPFKIVILDEADSMTRDAQAALRRTMEKQAKNTRFCLLCNYVSKIIEPLTSRCSKFRFKPLSEDVIFDRLAFICKEESINCSAEVLRTLIRATNGDMRRAITSLQSCARVTGTDASITVEEVNEVMGIVPEKWLQNFLSICKTKNYAQLKAFVKELLLEAYPGSQILEQVNEMLITSDLFTDREKAVIGTKLGVVSHRLQEGGSEYLQLMDLGCSVIKAFEMQA